MSIHKTNKGVFKRDEGFRLNFREPLQATIKVENNISDLNEPHSISCVIYDMSLQGAKINTVFELPKSVEKVKLLFEIEGESMSIAGDLVWSKKSYQGIFHGLRLDDQTYSERELFNLLKKYVNQQTTK